MRQHFQIKYIYQLCISNVPILIAKGFFLKQSNFNNQKLIAHPQWESNPRPPGDFTRHYKLWEWHFQLHDFRKSLHPHWHFMRQHFQIKIIYQLCIANAPILIAKGFFLKQSNFNNQKLIAHPQWESNPRPPGDFTRHYKLWEWHFQLHDFRKSLHHHWHFMRQHFQIKYIYQLCIANAPILIAKGFFSKQSNFYNQKLIAHPQWESNPRPPGDFTRHYKLWEWHFQLHDFRKSLHPHWHFMRQHFQIKIIYQLCIANAPILIAKGFLKQSNFYNQKLIAHPQWESNPRPPGDFTRHYKLWEWHFQLHDFRKSLNHHWHFMC